MLSTVWFVLITVSVICAIFTGRVSDISVAITEGASSAISLCINLASIMCFWSGLMEIMRKSGLTAKITHLLTPVLKLLFKEIRHDKAVLELVATNITANLLGLGNAATPIGLKAAKEICKIKQGKSAIDTLAMLIVINTASVQLIPTTVAAIRNSFGASMPYSILPAVWCASACALFTAIMLTILLRKIGN